MSLNRIVREGMHMHTVSDRKNGIARIQERLEWITIELKAIDTLLRSTLERPLFPQIIDPDEKMNVAVYRQLALEPEDQNYLEDELMQTENERLSSYPNWDLKCIFIENVTDRIAGKQCLREMMEQVRQGEFDLIILTNEKYCGDLLLQKYYNEDHLTKRKRKNNGECPQVHVEDAHPAIIDRGTFEAVQEILQQHQRFTAQRDTHSVYPFTGLIKCGCCGKSYRRKTTATGIVWICSTYNRKGKKYCPTAKQIPEDKLINACCEVLGISVFDDTLLKSAISQIIVPKPNHIRFLLFDGSKRTIIWNDRSRSESWTPEMRARTGQQTRERFNTAKMFKTSEGSNTILCPK